VRLLIIEQARRATPLVRELCRQSRHAAFFCRDPADIPTICSRHGTDFDWIVVNGMEVSGKVDLVDMLRTLGCSAPLVFLAAEEGAPVANRLPRRHTRRGGRLRLTRPDLVHLLTQPGGIFAGEELLFEYLTPPHEPRRSTRRGR
jgi:hypothetical protein